MLWKGNHQHHWLYWFGILGYDLPSSMPRAARIFEARNGEQLPGPGVLIIQETVSILLVMFKGVSVAGHPKTVADTGILRLKEESRDNRVCWSDRPLSSWWSKDNRAIWSAGHPYPWQSRAELASWSAANPSFCQRWDDHKKWSAGPLSPWQVETIVRSGQPDIQILDKVELNLRAGQPEILLLVKDETIIKNGQPDLCASRSQPNLHVIHTVQMIVHAGQPDQSVFAGV